jgi:glycerate kinase
MGKLPTGILEHAEEVPVALVAGRVHDREHLLQAGFAHVECINPPGIPLAEAMRKEVAQRNISRTVAALIRIH